MPVISTRSLTHLYSKGTPFEVAAIKDITIDIESGELVGIIGHTGSGKSTLIQHMNGILKPEQGTVLLEGKNIWESKASIREARFKVGLCFQYPEYQLFEETVYKDIAFGPKNMKLDEEEVNRRVHRAAEFVGLKEEHLQKSPFDLSGGEKRRAAIAGVMAMEPKVLILDEPTAGLDPRGRDRILHLIKEYRGGSGSTVLLVSHSMEDIAELVSKVLVLENARIAMFGTVEEVYSRGEELLQMGLNVPQVTRIFTGLRERGADISTNIFTVEQGRRELLRFFGKGGGEVIKDITIGQFFPGNSVLHRLDARMKLVLTFAIIVIVFFCQNFFSMGLMAAFVVLLVLVSRVPVKTILISLKPIVLIVVFTAVLNIFYTTGGTVLLEVWIIKITARGLFTALFMAVRIICLIIVSSLLTYTTTPTRLTDALERLLSPLKVFKIEVHTIAMMMTLALRFIPTLIEEIDRIMNAQKARGADWESGSLISRSKALIPVLIPLFVSSFRRAYELAFAMECRCYRGGKGRTRMKQMKLAMRDLAAVCVAVLLVAGIVVLNIFFTPVI